jgi:hypothetical protein
VLQNNALKAWGDPFFWHFDRVEWVFCHPLIEQYFIVSVLSFSCWKLWKIMRAEQQYLIVCFVLQLLETLKDNESRATWFIIGKHMDPCPYLVERIYAEGM